MSKTYRRAVMLVFAASMAVPLMLVALAGATRMAEAEDVAPCHHQAPASGYPSVPHHDCCVLGHNHGAPSPATVLCAPALSAEAHRAEISGKLASPPTREPALSSFDPPPFASPLRI